MGIKRCFSCLLLDPLHDAWDKRICAESDIQAVTTFGMWRKNEVEANYLSGCAGRSRIRIVQPPGKQDQCGKDPEQGKVPTTILQAAIIIGSGSASFEMLESVVRNSLIYFNPNWANTLCQPIGIRDVIKYLVGVLETEETVGKTYDIGGDEY